MMRELGAQVGAARSTVVPAALAEALLRRLLPELEPTRFQHLMRVARHELFCVLDRTGEGRCEGAAGRCGIVMVQR